MSLQLKPWQHGETRIHPYVTQGFTIPKWLDTAVRREIVVCGERPYDIELVEMGNGIWWTDCAVSRHTDNNQCGEYISTGLVLVNDQDAQLVYGQCSPTPIPAGSVFQFDSRIPHETRMKKDGLAAFMIWDSKNGYGSPSKFAMEAVGDLAALWHPDVEALRS